MPMPACLFVSPSPSSLPSPCSLPAAIMSWRQSTERLTHRREPQAGHVTGQVEGDRWISDGKVEGEKAVCQDAVSRSVAFINFPSRGRKMQYMGFH